MGTNRWTREHPTEATEVGPQGGHLYLWAPRLGRGAGPAIRPVRLYHDEEGRLCCVSLHKGGTEGIGTPVEQWGGYWHRIEVPAAEDGP